MNKSSNDTKIMEAATLVSSMSLAQLQEFQTTLTSEITKRRVENKREALTQIRNIAAANGLKLEDIIKEPVKIQKATRSGTGPAPIKYRHPEDSKLHWTGRGRRPQWVIDWQDSHAGSLDSLLVP